MEPYYTDDQVTLYLGDSLGILPTLPDRSVDAVVCDPPYGLEFMGKEWDAPWKTGNGFRRAQNEADAGRDNAFGRASRTSPEYVAGVGFQRWCEQWARECLRVLKPGGHMVAFGGTRTYHRLACAIEDAGFEIRDSIDWIYGSGMPKSLNLRGDQEGWGTALKPSHEPIVMARKPLAGTVSKTVEQYGTGALHIAACRVGADTRVNSAGGASSPQRESRGRHGYPETVTSSVGEASEVSGRWPANVLLTHAEDCAETCTSGCPVAEMDRQSGVLMSGKMCTGTARGNRTGWAGDMPAATGAETYGDSGGASRFFPVFRYEAKAGSAERPRAGAVGHPTVKPLALMQWLVRLVTPEGGTVLEPFAGSGTTLEACVIEGFNAIGIEREEPYVRLCVARLSKPIATTLFGEAS